MTTLGGRLAVVTGGGSGMGRELVRQLAAAGATVATCDLSVDGLAGTAELCAVDGFGSAVTTFLADVGDEAQVIEFRNHVARTHGTTHVNLLFNNAGIGGGGSMVADGREEWERVFGVCWGGVYLCTRAFLPMLMAADEGHIVNTSSINGLWTSLGKTFPNTAYGTAKFAVRGFTEALITDMRVNAPHVKVSLVLPGWIATDIVVNSTRMHGRDPKEMNEVQLQELRDRLSNGGLDLGAVGDDDLRLAVQAQLESFREQAITSAQDAARIILEGVRNNQWRILVGRDAHLVDRAVRDRAEQAYDEAFMDEMFAEGLLRFDP